MNLTNIESLLAEKLGEKNVIANADMGKYCSFRCGGRARLLVTAEDMDALRYTLYVIAGADVAFPSCGSGCGDSRSTCGCCGSCGGCFDGRNCCDDGDVQYMILGNGSNILVNDGGYDGILIKLGDRFTDIRVDGNRIYAGAAALLSAVSRAAAANGLAGLEFAGGIPGSIGGGAFMNAGAYGGELKDVIKSVKAVSRDGMREFILDASELELSYRHSIFEATGDIVTEVELELKPGNREDIASRMRELADKRSAKQPLKYGSAGSFFKRPHGYFAGALVEGAGLKGLTVGGAQVSELHAGFIINKDNATADDVVKLMKLVINTVYDRYGVMLEQEVRIIGKSKEQRQDEAVYE